MKKKICLVLKMPLGIVPNAVHSFTWEGVWRSVLAASPTTSLDIRKDAGHTLKSSLKVVSLNNSSRKKTYLH